MKDFINRVIFVDDNGTLRAPMAHAIFDSLEKRRTIISMSRGIVVLFPEPLNQKAEAVLISNNLGLRDYHTQELQAYDFSPETLVIAMERSQCEKIISRFPNIDHENTLVLNELVGDELEVIDPYGSSIQNYGVCYEILKSSVERVLAIVEHRNL